MNYHSDLDLMMIYEGDGRTAPPSGSSRHDRFELTDNFHYFTEAGPEDHQGPEPHRPSG